MPTMCGIDGCKAGWLAINIDRNNYQFGIYPSLFDLQKHNPQSTKFLIDVPLGLSSKSHARTIDSLMRKELPGRASTVFNAPSRKAVYAEGYEAAKTANLTDEGKSLSQQSFHIIPKIRDADEFLSRHPNFDLIESHPEICFKYLNNGEVVLSKKSVPSGIEERITILETYNKKSPDIYKKICNTTLRKHVRKDDIVDALCLSVVLEMSGENLDFLSDNNTKDERDIPIRIGYFNPI